MKQEWQECKQMSSIAFAQSKFERVSITKVEFFHLENILTFCNEEDTEITPENV